MNAGRNEFRKLVDYFVLNAIGEIEPSLLKQMDELTPRLREIYHHDGSWSEIIRHVLDLPADFEARIRALWLQNKEGAARTGYTLSPVEFTAAFVDKHFAGRT